ncbi:MAG TPA: competence/damage-inducible protein A [Rhodocyclaceae bacterium]|jgi:molybdopterin-biosynthesis enzyme MoeA-like protein|nr:competence/damage-inducible protein A [Rhodocyclaceae bacterium]
MGAVIKTFGALIIGDEIMRGKRQDVHFAKLRQALAERGLVLAWAQYLGDDRQSLSATLRRTLASGDVVFSFGGIGATPDDHTRQAVATAADVPLALHPEAEVLIRDRMREMGRECTPAQLEMGLFPQGSRIVPNPYNRIPGFSFGDHHFFPGFPVMAHPMLEWTLDTYYRDCFHAIAEAEDAIIVWQGVEGLMQPLMVEVEKRYLSLKVFSLPSVATPERPSFVELGVRGDPNDIEPAMEMLRTGVAALGYRWEALQASLQK